MCGIAGFIGNFNQNLLSTMNTTLGHRGPDDSGEWFDEENRLGLAHRRLSIIDTSSAGHQPMWDATGQIVIVFNGEIYNYQELKRVLIDRGYCFKNNTDTEVILNLYLDQKREFLKKLDGIFSFAIWDTTERELILARDGMGVKPLYYYENNSTFAFASELKSLLCLPIDKSIDYESIYHYISYLWCPSPNTMLKSVKKLEPGNALVVKNGKIADKWQFYEIPFSGDHIEKNIPEISNEIQRLLNSAVEKQMVSDVPVGAFLSGGLDSSAIVSYARKFTSHKLQCFTIDLGHQAKKEGFNNDLPYAKRVADTLNVDLNVISIGPEMVNDFPKMIYHLDEPQADPAPLNVYYISKLARENGVKVLLSGAGGDDLFTGYRRHLALQLEKYWKWIPGKLLSQLSCRIPNGNPILRRFKKSIEYADKKGDERIASYFHWINSRELARIFNTDFLKQTSAHVFSMPLIKSIGKIGKNISPLEKMLYLEQKHFLADHNLNYTDKMSMAAGVEVRVPFLDKELVEYSWKISPKLKQKGFEGKWILKKAMEGILPNDVIYRPKTGFGAPLRSWIHNEMSDMIDDIFSSTSMKNRGVFNIEEIKRLKMDDCQNKINASYPILSILCIEL